MRQLQYGLNSLACLAPILRISSSWMQLVKTNETLIPMNTIRKDCAMRDTLHTGIEATSCKRELYDPCVVVL
ncbi:MAG: hypothetical protein ACRCZJ_08845 [Erysipelotrichaceae bacterium]